MNSNWRSRPTTIDYIPEKIDWIVAIDESGNPDLSQAKKALVTGKALHSGENQFTVTACVIKKTDFISTRDDVMAIKMKYWPNGMYNYKGKEKRVCFHSREIRGKKEAFSPNVINYPDFITDISTLMSKVPVRLLSANIDKTKHVGKYKYPYDPYNLCLDFVLERLMWNIGHNETCCLVLEARGKKEDAELHNKIKRLVSQGNNQNPSSHFSKIKGAYFNPKWCHSAEEKTSYWILELADLCAYPIHKKFSYGTEDPAYKVLESKICGYPNIMGNGIKSFP